MQTSPNTRACTPKVGTLDDFRRFVAAAHARGIRVITELVLNHTSDQHAWFQRARRAPKGSVERDFYVWGDRPDRYAEARIIFKDFETSNWSWDKVAEAYYWHRFFSHQPDLQLRELRRCTTRCSPSSTSWFGLRGGTGCGWLDAVPYLYESEGTNCENLASTHAFLKKLRAHIDGRWKNRLLLAEANRVARGRRALLRRRRRVPNEFPFSDHAAPLSLAIHME